MAIEAAEINEAATGEDGEGIERDQYLVFTATDQEYGIQAMRVQEVSAMIEITRIPKAPVYIEGILNLRGRLVSIINFRKKFSFDPKEQDEDTRIVIVEHSGFPIGIMVDSVEEVIRIADEKVQKLPDNTTTASSSEYLTGIGILEQKQEDKIVQRLIILLDVDQLLSKTELLDAEAVRRLAGEAVALRAPERAAGERTEPRGHKGREAEPSTRGGR